MSRELTKAKEVASGIVSLLRPGFRPVLFWGSDTRDKGARVPGTACPCRLTRSSGWQWSEVQYSTTHESSGKAMDGRTVFPALASTNHRFEWGRGTRKSTSKPCSLPRRFRLDRSVPKQLGFQFLFAPAFGQRPTDPRRRPLQIVVDRAQPHPATARDLPLPEPQLKPYPLRVPPGQAALSCYGPVGAFATASQRRKRTPASQH